MRITLLIVATLALAACNNTPKPAETKPADTIAVKTSVDTAKAASAHVKMDPVCEMPYDKTWTDQTIYGTDTLTFCSEVCKKTFLARPKKYLKNI